MLLPPRLAENRRFRLPFQSSRLRLSWFEEARAPARLPPMVAFLALAAVLATEAAFFPPRLPARIATHFDAAGAPNDWAGLPRRGWGDAGRPHPQLSSPAYIGKREPSRSSRFSIM
ncbi:DUF1648 domain-containing protein [Methylocystis sp. JAN1]|uniref:DUF1648 domain-containing protein n=1 Tax=Methylocystis sp. JAN1 TaxID=3397211 RepID=UPI003FA2538B